MCWDCYNKDVDPYTERNVYREADEFETPYKKKGKAKTKKRFKGCPSRDGGAHIYVWVEFRGKHWRWYRDEYKRIDSTWWERLCVGCNHKNNTRYGWGWNPEVPFEVYEVRHVDHDWW